MAKKKRQQPIGGRAFHELASKLVQVPKEELDKQLAKRAEQRKK